MATMATGLNSSQPSGAAPTNGSPASFASSASFAAAWLDAALAWQSAAWAAHLEAMRLTQRACRPYAWDQIGRTVGIHAAQRTDSVLSAGVFCRCRP